MMNIPQKSKYEDYFKIDSRETTRQQFLILKDILKEYSDKNDIFVYEENDFLYFKVTNIKFFGDYLNQISHYAYYNDCRNLTEKEFYEVVEGNGYERNDLLKEVW